MAEYNGQVIPLRDTSYDLQGPPLDQHSSEGDFTVPLPIHGEIGKLDAKLTASEPKIKAYDGKVIPLPQEYTGKVIPLKDDSSWTDKAIGAGEAVISNLSGLTTGTMSGLLSNLVPFSDAQYKAHEKEFKRNAPNRKYTGSDIFADKFVEGSDAYTYSPRTKEGQEQAEKLGEIVNYVLTPLIGHVGLFHASTPRAVQKKIFAQVFDQVKKEGLAADKAAVEQAIKDRDSALPQRQPSNNEPLDYEHTTSPLEEPAVTPQDHNQLNYEGGINYDYTPHMLTPEEFVQSGGHPDAYPHYQQMQLEFNKPVAPDYPILSKENTTSEAGQGQYPQLRYNGPETIEMQQKPLDFTQEQPKPVDPWSGPHEEVNYSETPLPDETPLNINGSHENGMPNDISMENVGRTQGIIDSGDKYYRYNPDTGDVTPILPQNVADAKVYDNQAIVKVKADGTKETIQNNSNWKDPGLHARMDFSLRNLNPLGHPEGGAVISPRQIKEAITKLFDKDEVPKDTPEVTKLPNKGAMERKDQTVSELESEMVRALPDGTLERTYKDTNPYSAIGKPFQPGVHKTHPIERWMYGKIVKLNQLRTNLANDWLYGPKMVGFHPWRMVATIENTLKGGITDLERLHKLDPVRVDKLREYMETLNGVREPSKNDFVSNGFSEREANAAMSLRGMFANQAKATGSPVRPGFLPHMWEGPYRVWLTDKRTGEGFVFGTKNISFLNKRFDSSKYDITHSKVDQYNPLAESDIAGLFKIIDRAGLRDAFAGRLKDALSERGFALHEKEQKGRGGWLGSFESTPKDRSEAFIKSIKMYSGSAANHVSKMQVAPDVVSLMHNEALNNKYPNATKMAYRQWELANGDIYAVGKTVDFLLDAATSLYGGTHHDVSSTIRSISKLGTAVKVSVLNPGNLLANKLQPILATQMAHMEAGNISKAVLQSAESYANLRKDPTNHAFIAEMERRGVVTLSQLKELESPTIAERKRMGEDYTDTPETIGEKAIHLGKEGLLYNETGRTEIQSKLQVALFAKHLFENQGLDKATVWNKAEEFTQASMGGYAQHEKAPVYTNTGALGHTLSPLSTFATNELNKQLALLKGSVRGSAKEKHLKGLFGYSLAALAMGGGYNFITTKTADSFASLYNMIFPDSPIRLASESLMASDAPEALKVGIFAAGTRALTPHGIAIENSMSMPTGMGGLPNQLPFGMTFPWTLADVGASITSDLLQYQHITDDTLMKAEKAEPRMIAGMSDWYRTEKNGGNAVDSKGQKVYHRDQSEQNNIPWGKSLDEEKARMIIRDNKNIELRQGMSRKVLLDSVTKDIDNGKKPNTEELKKYLTLGGNISDVISKMEANKMKAKLTVRQQKFMDGLSGKDMALVKETQDIQEQAPQ